MAVGLKLLANLARKSYIASKIFVSLLLAGIISFLLMIPIMFILALFKADEKVVMIIFFILFLLSFILCIVYSKKITKRFQQAKK